jgi:hypothetical protein
MQQGEGGKGNDGGSSSTTSGSAYGNFAGCEEADECVYDRECDFYFRCLRYENS